MALTRSPFVVWRLYNRANLLRYLLPRHTSKSSTRNSHQNDILDTYTDRLLQETGNKWNEFIINIFLRRSKCNLTSNDKCQNEEYLLSLSIDEFQSEIIDSLNSNNIDYVVYLMKFSKNNRYRLHSGFMMCLIKLFAKLGNKEGVEIIQSLYKIANENEFINKCDLKHYTAQVLWYSGNTEECFAILEQLCQIQTIKHDVNFIIYDIICCAVVKNEASLMLTTRFAQLLVDKYNHYYPISILWKKLTESEWFADQQLANELLYNNREMIAIISPLIPLWCVQLIQQHKIDAVHKMCEVLLENNYLEHYSSVLHSLFDYYYKRRNLKLCSAVVKSATDLQIPLKASYQKQFLILLTTGKPDTTSKLKTSIPKSIENQINFKF